MPVADPATYRPKTSDIPEDPGVYRFRDAHGRVVYVGKAKNLRQRLTSYFADVAGLHPRTQQMVTTACSVEWTLVSTEVEALQLEYSWIKEYDPRFNVKYRDDKSYPYLAVTMADEFPRVQVMRGAKRKGTRYFGPYTHAWAIRETVDQLLRVFPVRTCSQGVFRRAERSGRACLLGYIEKCSAPCVGRITPADHRALADDFCAFMAGHTGRFVQEREARMRQAAADLDFETAARLRDDVAALTKALERSVVVLPDATDADVFAVAGDDLEAAVQVFHVRAGRIRGQRGWVVEKVDPIDDATLVLHLLQQVYGDAEASGVPREVLVPVEPPDVAAVADWLSGLRGARAEVRVPRRGDKKELMATVAKNAEQSLTLHRTRRAGDLTSRSRALQEIQEHLGLAEAPLRIECYDVSTLQGTETVASMVVFEDGLPRKGEYRKFTVSAAAAGDDLSAMYEVLTRRLRRLRDTPATAAAGDPGASPARPGPGSSAAHEVPGGTVDEDEAGPARGARFTYPPSLIIVDGGEPQVAAAARALADAGVQDIALAGLAKRLEEVWLPGSGFPLVLPRTSEGLYLLQRVRDEAHRFAITHHRARRSRTMTTSELDAVPGLGPARKKALLRAFGSVARLREASVEAVAAVQGIGPGVARAVVEHLAAPGPLPAFDPATGEIVEPT